MGWVFFIILSTGNTAINKEKNAFKLCFVIITYLSIPIFSCDTTLNSKDKKFHRA